MCDKSHVFVLSDSKALALALSTHGPSTGVCQGVRECAKYALTQLPIFIQIPFRTNAKNEAKTSHVEKCVRHRLVAFFSLTREILSQALGFLLLFTEHTVNTLFPLWLLLLLSSSNTAATHGAHESLCQMAHAFYLAFTLIQAHQVYTFQ